MELDERAEDGVRLFAEGVSIGRGRPGRSGTRRAVKLRVHGRTARRAPTPTPRSVAAELERARAHAAGRRRGPPRSGEILRSIFVRVWAELGRTHMALGRALELTPGAVVELDQAVEAPVELFANGLCFANGSLVVTADGELGRAGRSSSSERPGAGCPQDLGRRADNRGRLFLGVVPR